LTRVLGAALVLGVVAALTLAVTTHAPAKAHVRNTVQAVETKADEDGDKEDGDKEDGDKEDTDTDDAKEADDDGDGKERAEAFHPCHGTGKDDRECERGCQCIRRNEYYHQCKPPEGSSGCDIDAAKELVKEAKVKAAPFIKAAKAAAKVKKSTAATAAKWKTKAEAAKEIADKSEADYAKLKKDLEVKLAKPVNASKAEVAEAKKNLADILDEQKKVKAAEAKKIVDTVAAEKKARDDTAAEEDRTAKVAKEKQVIFNEKASNQGKTQWQVDEVLKGVQAWVDSLKVTWPGAKQYDKCAGTGVPKQTCSAGCICIEKNEYYHACQPPPGAGGGCDPNAARALIDAVKAKNTAVFEAAKTATNEKEEASKWLLAANSDSKKAKEAAAQALKTYEDKLKVAQGKAHEVLEAEQKKVDDAKAELEKKTNALKDQEKIRTQKIHDTLSPEIKVRDKKVKVAEVTGKASAKATKVADAAAKKFSDAAKRLKSFYTEVKAWQDALK